MPTYEYRCPTCGPVLRSERGDFIDCTCGATAKRRWSFQMAPVMHSHFNTTVGREVSDHRQIERELARKSAEMTERTGVEHRYVPTTPGDVKAQATDEGLDTTFNRMRAEGKDVKPWL